MSAIKTWALILLIGMAIGSLITWRLLDKPEPATQVNITALRDSIRTEVRAELRDSIRTVTVRKTITIKGADTVAVLDSAWYWENRNLYALIDELQIETRVETLQVQVVQQPKPDRFGLGLAVNWDGRLEGGAVKDNRFLAGPSIRLFRTNLAPVVGYRKGWLVGVIYTVEIF